MHGDDYYNTNPYEPRSIVTAAHVLGFDTSDEIPENEPSIDLDLEPDSPEDLWVEHLSVSKTRKSWKGRREPTIRSYFVNERTGRQIWDKAPKGATNVIPVSSQEQESALRELQRLLNECEMSSSSSSLSYTESPLRRARNGLMSRFQNRSNSRMTASEPRIDIQMLNLDEDDDHQCVISAQRSNIGERTVSEPSLTASSSLALSSNDGSSRDLLVCEQQRHRGLSIPKLSLGMNDALAERTSSQKSCCAETKSEMLLAKTEKAQEFSVAEEANSEMFLAEAEQPEEFSLDGAEPGEEVKGGKPSPEPSSKLIQL